MENGSPPSSAAAEGISAARESKRETKDRRAHSRAGLIFGVGAYGLWGVIPFYFKMLTHLAPLEVLAHRILWSCLLLAVILSVTLRWLDVPKILRSKPIMLRLIASTALIAVNWFTYIHAVSTNQVVEASLGYFLTPLVNVLLGAVFLGERMRPVQLASLAIAAVGVALLTSQGSGFPTIAVTLAISFAFYGLMRKTAAVDAAIGLFVETTLLAPVAAITLLVLAYRGESEAIEAGAPTLALLALGGIVTTTPLLFFAGAAKRLSMSTLGFLQYLAPSLQFVVAVAAFREPFSRRSLVSFIIIWIAVALYTADSVRQWRRSRKKEMDCEPTP